MRSVVALALVVAACDGAPEGGGPPQESRAVAFDWLARPVAQADILFVVDDSPSVAPYRDRIRAMGPFLDGALATYTIGRPDVHVGVTAPHDGPLTVLTDIHNDDGSRATNFAGALGDALSAALDVGSASSAPSQPLEAIARATANSDFLRADTSLLIVTVSPVDDQSSGAVSDYAVAVTAAAHYAVASGVYGTTAPRLAAFHQALAPQSFGPLYTAIESADYTTAFEPITNIIIDISEPCLEEPAGPPYECTVELVEGPPEAEVSHVVPPCDTTLDGECWSLVDDPAWCVSETEHLKTFEIRGYARRYRPHLRGQCSTHD